MYQTHTFILEAEIHRIKIQSETRMPHGAVDLLSKTKVISITFITDDKLQLITTTFAGDQLTFARNISVKALRENEPEDNVHRINPDIGTFHLLMSYADVSISLPSYQIHVRLLIALVISIALLCFKSSTTCTLLLLVR